MLFCYHEHSQCNFKTTYSLGHQICINLTLKIVENVLLFVYLLLKTIVSILRKRKKCRITPDLSSKNSGKCTKVQTYKHVFGPLRFKFRTPVANCSIFTHSYDGAIAGGVDVDDGNAVTQRLDGGW